MEEQKQKTINDLFAIRAGMSYIAELYNQTQEIKKSAYESKNEIKKDLCVNVIANGLILNLFLNDGDEYPWQQIDTEYIFMEDTPYGLNNPNYKFEMKILLDVNLDLNKNSPTEIRNTKEQIYNTFSIESRTLDGDYKRMRELFYEICSRFGFEKYDLENLPKDDDFFHENYIFSSRNSYSFNNETHFCVCLGKIENEPNYKEYIKFLNDALTFLKDKRRGMAFAFKAKKVYDQLIENFEKCKAAASELKKQCKEIADKCAEEVTNNSGLAKNVYAAFVKEYSNFLDPRDWKNIDLLIYYLQTGRADSLKEALQLTDRQQQTDAVVQALREINTTLRVGLNAINNTIIACTDRIVANQQLMLSQGALQNALLANASVSSKQLDITVHTVTG